MDPQENREVSSMNLRGDCDEQSRIVNARGMLHQGWHQQTPQAILDSAKVLKEKETFVACYTVNQDKQSWQTTHVAEATMRGKLVVR